MTVNSDIGCSYISEQGRNDYFIGGVHITACYDVVWTLTPAGFAQQERHLSCSILMYGLSFIICILFQLMSSGEIVFLVVEWNNVDSQSGYIHV